MYRCGTTGSPSDSPTCPMWDDRIGRTHRIECVDVVPLGVHRTVLPVLCGTIG